MRGLYFLALLLTACDPVTGQAGMSLCSMGSDPMCTERVAENTQAQCQRERSDCMRPCKQDTEACDNRSNSLKDGTFQQCLEDAKPCYEQCRDLYQDCLGR